MTSILVINAVSSGLAAAGIGGFLVRKKRRGLRDAAVEPVYVTTEPQRPLPPD
jgi:hypothetical protein